MNFRIFNNYMNAVINAIDAQHNHLDEQAETTFTNNGKWALHKLEKIFKDKDQKESMDAVDQALKVSMGVE